MTVFHCYCVVISNIELYTGLVYRGGFFVVVLGIEMWGRLDFGEPSPVSVAH